MDSAPLWGLLFFTDNLFLHLSLFIKNMTFYSYLIYMYYHFYI